MNITAKIVGRLKAREFKMKDGTKGVSRTLLIETDQYSGSVPVEFFGERAALVDAITKEQVGTEMQIGINLKGREWEGKYYASIGGWSIGPVEGVDVDPGEVVLDNSDESDNLPF